MFLLVLDFMPAANSFFLQSKQNMFGDNVVKLMDMGYSVSRVCIVCIECV